MRALARWGFAPLIATPFGAWALGFGDIELQSALNQPFNAQIALISATPEELQGLRVDLASQETFQRYGIDRPNFLSRFDFRVAKDGSGRSVIQISSRESVAEPFVTLLVEMTWPRGRLLREYTVLLDPPVLLPAPAVAPAVKPAETRPAQSNSGGAINRPAAPAPSPPPAPRAEPTPAPTTTSVTPPVSRTPAAAPGGTYGPVQRAETLWAIADRHRPTGVSMNRMMVAMYRANPQAFAGNMNLLLVGSTLRLPDTADLQDLNVSAANSEVQRQNDEWANRSPQQAARLRLVPPAETTAAPAPAPAAAPPAAVAERPAQPAAPATPAQPSPAAANEVAAANDQNRRLLDLQSEQLRALQQQAAQPPAAVATPPEQPPAASPGVSLEDQQVFTDEQNAAAPAADATPAPAAAVASPAAAPAASSPGPSVVDQLLGWLLAPALWIGLGVAALLFAALWYVRRKRQEPADATGRWDALQAEATDEDEVGATERMRRQLPEESIVVEESARPRRSAETDEAPAARKGSRSRAAASGAAAGAVEETLSSQTVINLDQADPVAEADFHMAYGLYDQAAELVQKALDAQPARRDLKLKLLEVFFVWGNKDAFLAAAQTLRGEIGQAADADWDKVVIMGKQICPDEPLFAEATGAPGIVDVDLEAGGDAPLDLAFDEPVDAPDVGVLDSGLDFDLDSSGSRPAPSQSSRPATRPAAKPLSEDSLDIGERTAAGLEAALFEMENDAEDADTGRRTSPDIGGDSLAVTQESPTIESPSGGRSGWDQAENATERYSLDAPTVETPTIETPSADAPTMETPTVETPRSEPPTIEQPSFHIGGPSDRTAEINLDDLGLDIKDLEGLPQDLGDLPVAASSETDTREQPALKIDDEDGLLSATGVTQVLRGDEEFDDAFEQRQTSVLDDQDATQLAPGYGDGTLVGTEVLDNRFEFDSESGDTSLVKSLGAEDALDLNLDDLSAALHGADTVEQPRSSPFGGDVFGGGATPLDLDVGNDLLGRDDPTGTEEASPLDPQTMTEVGTKLDLARAYIDMGDPEGARSILEEVLDEGDPGQRREAQSLIDVLSA